MVLSLIARLTLIAFATLASGLLTAFVQPITVEAPWEGSFPADGLGELNVNTPSGAIAVEAWDRRVVAVRATMRATGASRADAQRLLGTIRIGFEQEGTRLRGDVPEP